MIDSDCRLSTRYGFMLINQSLILFSSGVFTQAFFPTFRTGPSTSICWPTKSAAMIPTCRSQSWSASRTRTTHAAERPCPWSGSKRCICFCVLAIAFWRLRIDDCVLTIAVAFWQSHLAIAFSRLRFDDCILAIAFTRLRFDDCVCVLMIAFYAINPWYNCCNSKFFLCL